MKKSTLLFLFISCCSVEGQAGNQIVQGLFSLFPSGVQTSVRSTVDSLGGIANYAANTIGGYASLTQEEKVWLPVLFECCARKDYSFFVSLFNLIDYLGQKAGKSQEEISHTKRKLLTYQNKDGHTLLHTALMHPQKDLIVYILNEDRLLLKDPVYDVNLIEIKNNAGLSPMAIVAKNSSQYPYPDEYFHMLQCCGGKLQDAQDVFKQPWFFGMWKSKVTCTTDLLTLKSINDRRSDADFLNDYFVQHYLPLLSQPTNVDDPDDLFDQLVQVAQQPNTYDNHAKILQLINDGALRRDDLEMCVSRIFDLLAKHGKTDTISYLLHRQIFPHDMNWFGEFGKFVAQEVSQGYNREHVDCPVQIISRFENNDVKFQVRDVSSMEAKKLKSYCNQYYEHKLNAFSQIISLSGEEKNRFVTSEWQYIELRNNLLQRIQQTLPHDVPAEPVEPAAEEVPVLTSSQNFADGIQFLQSQLPQEPASETPADGDHAAEEEHNEPERAPSTLRNDCINLLSRGLHEFLPDTNRNDLSAVLTREFVNRMDQMLLGLQDHADREHHEVHVEAVPAAEVPAAAAPATLADWLYNTMLDHKIITAFIGSIVLFASYDLAKWSVHKFINVALGTAQFANWFWNHVKTVFKFSISILQRIIYSVGSFFKEDTSRGCW